MEGIDTAHHLHNTPDAYQSRNGSKPVEGIDTLSCSSMPEWVKRDAIRKEEILSEFVKSGRSYEEIMNFLNAGSDGEKTEK